VPFIPSHLEIIGLVDAETGAKITENHLTTKTNLSIRDIAPGDDITRFLKIILFPSHGVIVRPSSVKSLGDGTLFKGLQDFDEV